MKRIFIIFFLIFCFSCSFKDKEQFSTDICIDGFFSKKHRNYITTEEDQLSLENISYQAEINNFKFDAKCIFSNNKYIANLSILFVVQPVNAKTTNIVMPYYIALLDSQNNILDIQYYKVKGSLNNNEEKTFFIETEIIDNQSIIFKYKDKEIFQKNKIMIGFMLNKEKLKIVN